MGTVKALVGFLVIVAVIYCAFQIIPPELTNYSFQDDLRNIAMVGGANPHETDQELIDSIVKKAQEHQIALAPEQRVLCLSTTTWQSGSTSGVRSGRLQRSGKSAGIFIHTSFHSFQRKPRNVEEQAASSGSELRAKKRFRGGNSPH